MKLSMMIGYAGGFKKSAALVVELEKAGLDVVWVPEAYSFDAISQVGYLAAVTERVEIGTGIVNVYSRTASLMAQTAAGCDYVSDGRFILGLGASGPQVVEGWYGQHFAKPLARTREYVRIMRQVWEREAPVTSDGPHYPLPLRDEAATGLGKPLKSIVHPLRPDIPIFLGAEGPKNIALTAEIADGWLPLFYTPRMADTYNAWLDEGFARPGARRTRETFEICATAQIVLTDDPRAAYDGLKPFLALYMGGMGSEDTNFHAEVYRRMGYGEVVDEVTSLFRSGRKAEAAQVIPDAVVYDSAIIGDEAHVRARIAEWEASGVTTMLVSPGSVAEIERLAGLVS